MKRWLALPLLVLAVVVASPVYAYTPLTVSVSLLSVDNPTFHLGIAVVGNDTRLSGASFSFTSNSSGLFSGFKDLQNGSYLVDWVPDNSSRPALITIDSSYPGYYKGTDSLILSLTTNPTGPGQGSGSGSGGGCSPFCRPTITIPTWTVYAVALGLSIPMVSIALIVRHRREDEGVPDL